MYPVRGVDLLAEDGDGGVSEERGIERVLAFPGSGRGVCTRKRDGLTSV